MENNKIIELKNSEFVDNSKFFNYKNTEQIHVEHKQNYIEHIFKKCNTLLICNTNYDKVLKSNNIDNINNNIDIDIDIKTQEKQEIYYFNLKDRKDIDLLVDYLLKNNIQFEYIYTTLKYTIEEEILKQLNKNHYEKKNKRRKIHRLSYTTSIRKSQ